MCLLRRAVILYLSISLPCPTHLLDYLTCTMTPEARLNSPTARRGHREGHLPKVIQLEKGRAWVGTHSLGISSKGEKRASTHTARVEEILHHTLLFLE